MSIQSDLSNTDTEGTYQSVHIRGAHIEEVNTMRPLFKRSVAKSRLTLVFKLHLNLLIHRTKKLSFSSIQYCRSQLQIKFSRRQITVLTRNELLCNASSNKL